jgi:hypothetical protein
MADWGTGIYENDDVMDWVYDLLDSGNLKTLKYALDIIDQDPVTLEEVSDCRIALAAADLIASLDGDINPNLPEEAEDWITMMDRSAVSLRSLAEDVVSSILDQSALKTFMQKKDLLDDWIPIIKGLLKRLEQ